jgi:hypothetical protein
VYRRLLTPPIDESDADSRYPEGDSVICVDEVGCLLLLGHASTTRLSALEAVLAKIPAKENLHLHQRLVAEYLDGANLAIIDALVLLGMLIEQRLESEDFPAFTKPTDAQPVKFLEYVQVSLRPRSPIPDRIKKNSLSVFSKLTVSRAWPQQRQFAPLKTSGL